MKTSTAVKMFAIAIAATLTFGMSQAQAGGCRLTQRIIPQVIVPQIVPAPPVLGIYGFATTQGMVITDVVRGSEAWRIGLERGDVIVEIDGRHIHNERDFDVAMSRVGRHTDLLVRDSRGRGLVNLAAHLFDVRPVLRSQPVVRR